MANDTEFGLAAYFYTRDWGASGAWPRRSNMAWSASYTGLISTANAPFGAASSSPAWAAKAPNTGSMTIYELKYVNVSIA